MKVGIGGGGIAVAVLLGSMYAGQSGMGAQARAGSSAQPVAVTLEVKSPRGAVLGHASIGIATGPDQPFSFYPSDAEGDVIVSLAPGAHELRLFARGYPMTYERLDVTAPGRVAIVLGRGTESRPETPVAEPEAARRSGTPASGGAAARKRKAEPARVESGGAADPLQAYTSCSFPDGLEIQAVKPLTAGPLLVKTASGTQTIDTMSGEQVMFGYPMTDFFANAKVEQLPADQYAQSKEVLLANLRLMESERNGPVTDESWRTGLHGFEVQGNNRTALDSDVLGMYLLFDDANHVVTTVSFLNQHAWERKFQTMAEYERLRDSFLRNYTGCVRQNQVIER